jgi:hypothetical protein
MEPRFKYSDVCEGYREISAKVDGSTTLSTECHVLIRRICRGRYRVLGVRREGGCCSLQGVPPRLLLAQPFT